MQKSILFFLIAFNGIFVLTGCQSKKSSETNNNPTISVSILPQKYLIDRLTDNQIEVNVMVPPGTSPEMYEPSPVQMKKVANSAVYFAVGPLEFENTILPKIKELNPEIKFINQSNGINLMEGHRHHDINEEDEKHTCYDPHIWTSALEYRKMANEAFKVLCNLFPNKTEQFKQNLAKVNSDIDSLNSHIKRVVSTAKTKNFIIFHPALSYFARDYGLTQIAIEEDGKNPSAQKLGNIVKLAKAEGLKYVFIQSQFDSHNAEILAGELGGEIITIDPLGYDWLKNMYDLTDKLAVALRPEAARNHE